MTDLDPDKNWPEKVVKEVVKEQLDQSIESLDYSTQLKLQQAREAALNQGATKQGLRRINWRSFKWGMPPIAVAATVAAITITQMSGPQPEVFEPIWLEDIELLAADEELEFIEDLEFYEWLEQDAQNTLES